MFNIWGRNATSKHVSGGGLAMKPIVIFILFLVVPLLEIYLLLEVGSQIGALWTIFLIVLTAFVGARLVRLQGMATWRRFQSSISEHELPALALFEGFCLLIVGALLLTPGFFTDAVGFAGLIPSVRRLLIKRVLRWGIVKATASDFGRQTGPDSIDGNFKRIDD